MTQDLKRLWNCWISDRRLRKPDWKTWARLLTQMPRVNDNLEDNPYYSIYKDRIDNGQYRPEPMARGRWVKGEWLMKGAT